jgi:hypothetical protein
LVVCYSVVVYLGSVARARNKKPSFLVLRDQVETDVGTAFAVHLGMDGNAVLFVAYEIVLH